MLRHAITALGRMHVQQKVRLVTPQFRMIHQRGYTLFDDHYADYFHECNMALMGAKNTDNIVFVF